MKKILALLILSSPCMAGTITTAGSLMQITYSSATPAAGSSSPAVVQCVHGGQFNGTGATVSISVTNGNTIIAGLATQSVGNFTSIKDNNAVNLTRDNSGFINNSGQFYDMAFYRESNVSGVTGVTTAWSGSSVWGLIVCEVSGLAASPVDVIDNVGVFNTATTAFLAHSITTTNSNDIVFGVFDNGGGHAYSGSGSWILGATDDEGGGTFDTGITYQIMSTSGAKQPAATAAVASTGGGVAASYHP